MKILVDMNLSPRWREALEASGYEAVWWRDVGPANAPDEALPPVLEVLRRFSEALERGALAVIGPKKTRLRLLPLQ